MFSLIDALNAPKRPAPNPNAALGDFVNRLSSEGPNNLRAKFIEFYTQNFGEYIAAQPIDALIPPQKVMGKYPIRF